MAKEALDENKLKSELDTILKADVEVVEPDESVSKPADPYEAKAREKGWVPKEEFDGDPEEWASAKEFLKRGEYLDHIHKVNRELKQMKKVIETFKDQYTKGELKLKQQEVAKLERDLEVAADERDIKRALEIKDRITEVKEQVKSVESPQIPDEYKEWVTENEWYTNDAELNKVATRIGYGLYNADPERPIREIYDEVTEIVKQRYPEKFKKEAKSVTTVTTTSKKVSTKTEARSKAPSYRNLPKEAQLNYKRLVKSDKNPHGFITHEDFMKDYIAAGGDLIEE